LACDRVQKTPEDRRRERKPSVNHITLWRLRGGTESKECSQVLVGGRGVKGSCEARAHREGANDSLRDSVGDVHTILLLFTVILLRPSSGG
jgi:hypothetical protein